MHHGQWRRLRQHRGEDELTRDGDDRDTVPAGGGIAAHGRIDERGFRDFVFTNAARLHGPDFFRGTVVEAAVAGELGR